MDLLHAILLGLVEGLTEFLPVSSTAHLSLTAKLFDLDSTDFLKTFIIAIQPGAILAVVVLYGRRLLVDWQVLLRVLAAFVPTAVLGLLLKDRVREMLDNHAVILAALAIGGVVLIVFEWKFPKPADRDENLTAVTWTQAVLIGTIQAVSFIPGVSRAAATILGGMMLGLPRRTAVEFSFLLAVPTMTAATALDLKELYESGGGLQAQEWQLLAAGFVTSFVAALLTIQFLLRYIKTHNFWPFGVYRILFAAAMCLLLFPPVADAPVPSSPD